MAKTPKGTPAAYMGADKGPFRCDHCEYIVGAKDCKRPEVIAELGENRNGYATIEAGGCCNHFHPSGKTQSVTLSLRGLK